MTPEDRSAASETESATLDPKLKAACDEAYWWASILRDVAYGLCILGKNPVLYG